MPIPTRDRELLEAAGFDIRETDSSYEVVPRDPPSHYDKDGSGTPRAVGIYFKCLQVGDGICRTLFDSPMIQEYRNKAFRTLGMALASASGP